jgi:hypothetical protein
VVAVASDRGIDALKESRMKSLWFGLGLLVLPGCVVGVEHDHDSAPSTLTVDWTIDGTHNPSECRQGDTPSILIQVLARRDIAFEREFDCEESSVTFDISPGTYFVSATLLDSRGDDATTTVDSDDFDLLYDDDYTVNIDFPADSFL